MGQELEGRLLASIAPLIPLNPFTIMDKYIANVINNNYNSLIKSCGCSKPQGKTLKKLGTQILKEGTVVLNHLKDKSSVPAEKQSEAYGNMLDKVDLTEMVNKKIMSRFLNELKEDMVIAYDLTDEIHKYADLRKNGMEKISKVLDGSERKAQNGYFLHGIGTDKYLLRLDVHNSEKNYLPQTRKSILEELLTKFKGKGIWAFDRGNDDKKLFAYLNDKAAKFLVRIQKTRCFCLVETGEEVNVENLPLGRYEVFVRNSKNSKYDTTRKYGVIKAQPDKRKDPITILFSLNLSKYTDRELVKKYLDRWGVENQFRRVKTLYKMEGMMVRKWKRRKNLMALILLSHFLAKTIQEKLTQEKDKNTKVFLEAWNELKSFLKRVSKYYNDYSFVDFLRTKIPNRLSFFLRVKNQHHQSQITLNLSFL